MKKSMAEKQALPRVAFDEHAKENFSSENNVDTLLDVGVGNANADLIDHLKVSTDGHVGLSCGISCALLTQGTDRPGAPTIR